MADKEYIEREARLKEIDSAFKKYEQSGNILRLFSDCRKSIIFAPAADVVEVRHERWVDNHCTGCGMMPLGEEIWTNLDLTPPKFEWFMDFCPCCGADMRGKRDGLYRHKIYW